MFERECPTLLDVAVEGRQPVCERSLSVFVLVVYLDVWEVVDDDVTEEGDPAKVLD